MNDMTSNGTLSAADHAHAMVEYIADGTRRAYALGNRGPIRMGADGKLHRDILDAYWKLGFYIFEGVVGAGPSSGASARSSGYRLTCAPARCSIRSSVNSMRPATPRSAMVGRHHSGPEYWGFGRAGQSRQTIMWSSRSSLQ